MEPCAAFSAIAWSEATHARGLLEASPSTTAPFILQHTPAALAAWATAWRTRLAGPKSAGGLAQARGPRLSALLQSDLLALSPLTPAPLATYRQAFSPSRAKDAPQAADALLAVLCPHRDRLQAWQPEKAQTRTRPSLVEPRRRLVQDRPRRSQRMTALVHAYCPQVVQGCHAIRPPRVWAFLLRWPPRAAVPKLRPAPLEKCCHAPNAGRHETRATRLAASQAAGPLTTAQAGLRSFGLMLTALATQRQTTLEALRDFDDAMEQLGRRHEASPLLASLPGAGPVSAARLTAARGTDRDRWTTAEAWLGFSGGAPGLARRGKSTWRRWRSCCPTFLRPACHA